MASFMSTGVAAGARGRVCCLAAGRREFRVALDVLTKGFGTAAIMFAHERKSVNVLVRYLEQAEQNA
jgi:hypothetical protein